MLSVTKAEFSYSSGAAATGTGTGAAVGVGVVGAGAGDVRGVDSESRVLLSLPMHTEYLDYYMARVLPEDCRAREHAVVLLQHILPLPLPGSSFPPDVQVSECCTAGSGV